jgi:hypothetical protein
VERRKRVASVVSSPARCWARAVLMVLGTQDDLRWAAYVATGKSAKRQARMQCGSRHAHATFGC